jgi:phosphate starvation-inducible PhoH-like protein
MPEKKLVFQNPRHLAQLYCAAENNLRKAETALGLNITSREDWLLLQGTEIAIQHGEALFDLLDKARIQGMNIRNGDFEMILKAVTQGKAAELAPLFSDQSLVFTFRNRSIVAKTLSQKQYLLSIRDKDIVFGIGPAGTGKTYLAVAAALDALTQDKFKKLILTRPAVEAGEALGFLPGDLEEKIQPYLRPLYDAIHEMLGKENTLRLIEKGLIEIAPLAYMRGRTLSDACILLDEAQNTTPEQMMMFLTRMGEGSRMIITGDITQIDLPRHKYSGLKEAIDVLKKVEGIGFHFFKDQDVVRNPLVQRIVEAYANYNKTTGAHERREPDARSKSELGK